MNDVNASLLAAFCKAHKIPLKHKCHHCKQLHDAVSYRISDATDYEDDDCDGEPDMWFSVDYGRCDAMTKPGQCCRMSGPVSKKDRDEMRQMYMDLMGKP